MLHGEQCLWFCAAPSTRDQDGRCCNGDSLKLQGNGRRSSVMWRRKSCSVCCVSFAGLDVGFQSIAYGFSGAKRATTLRTAKLRRECCPAGVRGVLDPRERAHSLRRAAFQNFTTADTGPKRAAARYENAVFAVRGKCWQDAQKLTILKTSTVVEDKGAWRAL